MSDKVLIAVYGSLRVGMSNAGVNSSGGGVYKGTGRTVENYNLYRYKGSYFPAVSLEHNSNNKPVVVDVFEAPLSGLTGAYDRLEGCHAPNHPSNFYNRTEVDVELNGEVVKAWIYNIPEEQHELVESGDWCLYCNPHYYEAE